MRFIFFKFTIILLLFSFSCKTGTNNYINSSDGVEIRYDKQGNGQPTLVFVHGWANNKSIWDAQVEYFSKKYSTVTVDLAGFGESGNNRDDWTVLSFSKDVEAVINHLELKNVVLIGFSMGAPVVIETAIRVSDKISGIVLVDYLYNIETKYPPEVIRYMDSVYMDLVTNPTMKKLDPFFKNNKEASYKKVLKMINSDVPKIGWKESINDVFRWENDDFVKSLSNLNMPIISINSDNTVTNVDGFKKHIPSFKAKIMHDVGHVVFWDNPELFNAFLEESIQEFIN